VVVVYLPGFVGGMAGNDESKNDVSVISAHDRRRAWMLLVLISRGLKSTMGISEKHKSASCQLASRPIKIMSWVRNASRGIRPNGRLPTTMHRCQATSARCAPRGMRALHSAPY
jgi:hypothetical protein